MPQMGDERLLRGEFVNGRTWPGLAARMTGSSVTIADSHWRNLNVSITAKAICPDAVRLNGLLWDCMQSTVSSVVNTSHGS